MYAQKNITRQKCMAFSVRIYNLCKYLTYEKQERIISRQLLRSGTSIGANLAEAKCAISSSDFLAKVYIAYKECSESLYWLELLRNTEIINDNMFNSLNADCMEIYRLLTATIKTKKKEMGDK
ncbi:MAG: four helix bundle protein [Alphaproteobacteria bacterium]|nr:four helix bundle protein [Alphaproteobacteria bacterium]MBQ7128061.1 four helix bundle protein [Alphaproteobacteria bacterium]